MFAIYAISALGETALPYDLFSIVFVIVIISILVQGTLLPLMSRKMRMLGENDDVLRTFNDYTEESDVSFVKVVVGENHPWAGKKLKQCVMPREFLVVLLLRGEEVIVPNGNTPSVRATYSLPPRPSLKTAKISACSRSLSAKITRGRAKRCANWNLRPARSSP